MKDTLQSAFARNAPRRPHVFQNMRDMLVKDEEGFSWKRRKLWFPIPAPKPVRNLNVSGRRRARAALSFGMSPETVVVERAQGAVIEDVDGNLFLDFVSGFGSLNAGHCHPKVVSAMQRQAEQIHQAMSLGSRTRNEFLEKVLSLHSGATPKSMILGTSGSEAAEIALKMAPPGDRAQ